MFLHTHPTLKNIMKYSDILHFFGKNQREFYENELSQTNFPSIISTYKSFFEDNFYLINNSYSSILL